MKCGDREHLDCAASRRCGAGEALLANSEANVGVGLAGVRGRGRSLGEGGCVLGLRGCARTEEEVGLMWGVGGARRGRTCIPRRVLGGDGQAAPGLLVAIWQAHAAGRHSRDPASPAAPLDPRFTGTGRAVTDADGWYQFET
ncbi:hypothetical protein B1218_36565, partial [Pseudomonas ogarae]